MDKKTDEELLGRLKIWMEKISVSQMIDHREIYLDWLKVSPKQSDPESELRKDEAVREIQMLKALGAIVGFDGTGEMRRRAHEQAKRVHEGTDPLTGPGSPERGEDSEGAAGHH